MKKRLFVGILSVIFMLCVSVPAYAIDAAQVDINDPNVIGEIVIIDPVTGESWSWDLPVSCCSSGSMSNTRGNEEYAEVSVDIGEYLIMTMSPPDNEEKVKHSDITLTAGLRYSVDVANNLIAIHRAYGSALDNGDYYASYKEFYYANPAVFGPIRQTPIAESWSYTTNSTAGAYSSDAPPYALLDCRVTVAGMESSYRIISVSCKLDFI